MQSCRRPVPNCSLHDFRLRVGADVRWAQGAVRTLVRGEKEVRFFGERRDLELRTNNHVMTRAAEILRAQASRIRRRGVIPRGSFPRAPFPVKP